MKFFLSLHPFSALRCHLWPALSAIVATALAAETVTLPPVHVTGMLPDDARLPAGVGVRLDADEIASWRPPTLHEALAFLPGVRALDDDITGRRSGIAVRAAPPRRSRKVLLLEDGVPINAATYLDPSAHYTPPLERLAAIDVLKGAGHLVHGPINNYGVLNFRNHRPTATPVTTVALAAGGDSTWRRHIRHTRTAGTLGLVAAYTGFDADGVFDVEQTSFDDGFLSLDWNFAPHHVLRLSVTVFRERSAYDESNLTPAEYAVAPQRKRGRFAQEYNTFALDHTRADLVHTFSGDRHLVSTRVFGTSFDRPRFTVDPGDTPVDLLPGVAPENPFAPPQGIGTMVGRDRFYRSIGAENRIEIRPHPDAPRSLTHQMGTRLERQWLNDRRTTGGAGEILSVSHRGPRTRDEAYRASAASFFVRTGIAFRRFQITPGVRVEHYSQSRERRSLPADPGPHAPRSQVTHSLILPAVTLEAETEPAHWFAHVGRGYTPAFARTAQDNHLEPETALNFQLGARSRNDFPLRWSFAAFHDRVRDTVVQMPFTIDHRDVYLNSEDSRATGVDVAARWTVPVETAHLFVEASWTYVDARFRGGLVAGHRVPEIPRHAGSVSIGWHQSDRWQVSLSATHQDDFYTDPSNQRELVLADEDGVLLGPGDEFDLREPVVFGLVPGRTILSARASHRMADGRGTVWVQVRNLADRLYLLDVQNGLRPGARRNWTAGLTWHW